jgi:hypothetical protein
MKTKIQSVKKTKLKLLKLKKDELKNETKIYDDFEKDEDSFDETTLSDQEIIYQTTFINEEDTLKRKIKELYLDMEWIERMDLTVANNDELNKLKSNDLVYNDFQRENYFYKQALLAISQALPKLNDLGVQTKKPDDYYANMTKSDQYVKKVKQKLINDQVELESKEQSKQIKEMQKLGKQIKQQAELAKDEFKNTNKISRVDNKDKKR